MTSMGNYQWYMTKHREELLEEIAVEELIKKHGKSNNPQGRITDFGQEGILKIPHIYTALENPDTVKKSLALIKDRKEMTLLSDNLMEWVRLFNKRDREMVQDGV